MAYCTAANVASELTHITISDSSDPTTTEVTAFIAEIEAEMNTRFNAIGIDIPITSPADALSYAKRISINAGAARVLRSVDKASEPGRTYQKLYDEAMKNIEKNPRIMQDVGQTYVAPGGSDQDRPSKWSRSGDQW